MSKLLSQEITYSVNFGNLTKTFNTLREARAFVRDLASEPGSSVQIVKNLTRSEILNTYVAEERKVLSFVATEPEQE